ncbi:unnamed protein product [Schistosoma margrebowiei]|uniref:GDNF/GAS1 domain-containing protein n=1 Tax=Schistosoma margrebowiei TaxID=48269 RepID=A0AA85AB02_9TREM|nr:unnamed protein product [Schistosoma margrebowiei]
MCNLFNSYLYFISLIHLPYYLTQTDWDIRANVIFPSLSSSSSTTPITVVSQKSTKYNVGNEMKNAVTESSRTSILQPVDEVIEKQEIRIDCLEALHNCESISGICKVDVDIFKTFCGDWTDERSLMGCQRKYLRECQSALRTMNLGRPGLKHCICDSRSSRSIDDLTKCNLLRKNLNNHPCLAEPPIFLRELHTSGNFRHESRKEIKPESKPTQSTSNMNTNVKRLNTTSLLVEPFVSSIPMTTESPITMNTLSSVESSNSELVDQHLNKNKQNTSCLDLLENCTKLPACAIALNKFRALCTVRTCNKLKSQCLEASKKFLQLKTHMNCDCKSELNEGRYRRCLDYKEAVIDNKCVEISSNQEINLVNGNELEYSFVNMNMEKNLATIPVSPDYHTAVQNNSTSLENETLSVLHHSQFISSNISGQRSNELTDIETIVFETWNNKIECYSIFYECLREPVCLQHFVNLRYGCAQMNRQFIACRNPNQCINSLELFYKETNSLVNKAISCTCAVNDLDCQQIQNVFVPRCIRQSYGLRMDCYQAWVKCQNDPVCRTSYDLLVSECHTSNGLCYLNPSACLNSYRRLWSGPWAGGCSCEVTRPKLNPSNNVLTGCSEFGRILTQPPCVEITPETHQLESPTLTHNPLYCKMMKKLQMPSEDFVRIPSLRDYQEEGQLARNCSLLCNCHVGCRYEMCYETEMKTWHAYSLSNRTSQNVTLPTRIQTINIYQANLSLGCLYLPKFNRHCVCYAYDHVVCDVFIPKNQYFLTGHKLLIDFDVEMYSTTIDLLADDKSLSEYEFYGSIIQLEFLLTNFLAHLFGQKSCRLILSAYQTIDDKHFWLKQHSTNNNSNKLLKRLEYLLAINLDTSFPTENKTSLCINLLEVLTIMINDQYPQIRYHAKFSTFQKSIFKAPGFNEHYDLDRTLDKTYRLQQLQRQQQQQQQQQETQAWRHIRTSVQMQSNNKLEKNNSHKTYILSYSICSILLIFTMSTNFF